jgi:hypothetical protein
LSQETSHRWSAWLKTPRIIIVFIITSIAVPLVLYYQERPSSFVSKVIDAIQGGDLVTPAVLSDSEWFGVWAAPTVHTEAELLNLPADVVAAGTEQIKLRLTGNKQVGVPNLQYAFDNNSLRTRTVRFLL